MWVEPKPQHRSKSGSCPRQVYNPRLIREGVRIKRNTDIPQGAMVMQMQPTLEPLWLEPLWSMSVWTDILKILVENNLFFYFTEIKRKYYDEI
ncbi:MAG: hypothetical protein A2888_01110 [Chlamydiae bacterium RIFCSPLOWO2_01_FULL_28_7]|nr:MAG: hypothetical protein A2888_01110 [Chlamydiae bacterium RIFCSPLOWO2_01_FULL_28_7]